MAIANAGHLHFAARRAVHTRKLLSKLHKAGRPGKSQYWIARGLGSFDVKYLATLQAYHSLRPHRRPPNLKLESIAHRLDPWSGTNEPVLVHWKPKNSFPFYRTVMDFGFEHRSLQYLLRNVLGEVLERHPSQCLLNGGTHAAIKRAANAMNAGLQWAAELDISDCYASFDGSRLSGLLPIPEEVTANLVTSGFLNLVPGNLHNLYGPEDDHEGDPIALDEALRAARRGIPQGSALSPLVAESMIAIALGHITMNGVIVVYADNVLILSNSESGLTGMTQALGVALKDHPAGRLRPSTRLFPAGSRVEFLGHWLTPRSDGVRIDPSQSNREKFEARIRREISSLANTAPSPAWKSERRRLAQFILAWTGAFKLCRDIQNVRSYWLLKIPCDGDSGLNWSKSIGAE